MTTSQADDLLAQIRKDPADDVPRQVYADLLEQRGDVDRAQLIQLQVRRAALPTWDAEVTALELQERALLARHGADWRAGLPALRGVTWGSFTRGFVGKVAFDTLDAFAEHRAACLAAAPVRSIAIRWPRSAKQAPLAAIDGVDELTVFGTVMRPDDLKWLAGCPLLLLPITVALAGIAPPLIEVALPPSIRYQSVPSVYTRPFPPDGIVQAATGEQTSVGPPLAIVTVAVPTLLTSVTNPVEIVEGSVPVHPVAQFAR